MNVERGVERLAQQAEKLSSSLEKLVTAARKGDHSALADKLERLQLQLKEHLEGLEEHRSQDHAASTPVAQADVTRDAEASASNIPVETNADVQSEDVVEEAAKESFPASDPPSSY